MNCFCVRDLCLETVNGQSAHTLPFKGRPFAPRLLMFSSFKFLLRKNVGFLSCFTRGAGIMRFCAFL